MKLSRATFFSTILGMVSLYSQNRQLLYDFHEIPQALTINPGARTHEKWHIGIPVVSGASFQAGVSAVTVNDLFANDGADFNTKVRERVLNALNRRDDFSSTVQIDLLNIGFRNKNRPKNYYSLGIYGETDIIVYWPKDLAILAFEGNGGANIGRSFDLGHLSLRGEMVNVFHFGVNRKMRDELTIGVRAKIYSSMASVRSTNNSGTFRTFIGENNNLTNTIVGDLELNTAGVEGFWTLLIMSPLLQRTLLGCSQKEHCWEATWVWDLMQGLPVG